MYFAPCVHYSLGPTCWSFWTVPYLCCVMIGVGCLLFIFYLYTWKVLHPAFSWDLSDVVFQDRFKKDEIRYTNQIFYCIKEIFIISVFSSVCFLYIDCFSEIFVVFNQSDRKASVVKKKCFAGSMKVGKEMREIPGRCSERKVDSCYRHLRVNVIKAILKNILHKKRFSQT